MDLGLEGLEQEARQRALSLVSDQLPLALTLPDSARFGNFVAGPNDELVRAVYAMASTGGDSSLYLWGGPGLGKTHLLQAACRESGDHGLASAYLSLRQSREPGPAILQGFEHLDLLCVDDWEAIGGERPWEQALFDLFNRMRDCGRRLLMAGSSPPEGLGLGLPDLVSRLEWGLVYAVRSLDDAGRLQVLQLRAQGRGFELPDETGAYLLRRYPRDLPALCGLLERLDQASLVAQRRLTIPFVKAVLGS
jgi:DnaA family protein